MKTRTILLHGTTNSSSVSAEIVRLGGEPKTLARIQHTLKTGKPLRN